MNIEIHTVYFQLIGKNKQAKQFRITIPSNMIPEAMVEILIAQGEELKNLEETLQSENATIEKHNQKRAELKKNHKNLFALFMNLENNLNLLTFGIEAEKSAFYNEQNQLEKIDTILKNTSNYFNKEIKFVIPSSKRVPSASNIELLESKNKEIENIKYNLRFMNDFFKNNISYLIKNKDIDNFIEVNESKFNEIEKVVSNV